MLLLHLFFWSSLFFYPTKKLSIFFRTTKKRALFSPSSSNNNFFCFRNIPPPLFYKRTKYYEFGQSFFFMLIVSLYVYYVPVSLYIFNATFSQMFKIAESRIFFTTRRLFVCIYLFFKYLCIYGNLLTLRKRHAHNTNQKFRIIFLSHIIQRKKFAVFLF